MSHSPYDTPPPPPSQLQSLISEHWEQEVLSQLPQDYEQHARRLGAFVRPRELRCVGDLLRGLLAYVLCAPSLRHLGAWAVLIGLANLSHVAWQKRLRAARDWLLWLLCQRLAVPAGPAVPGASRLIEVDATRVREQGGNGDDYRLHLAYDLGAGCLVEVKLSDRHTAEGFRLFDWRPGDIVVADRGYSRRKELAWVLRAGAQVVVRLAPQHVPLLDRHGEPFDVLSWLRQRGSGQFSVPVAFQDQHGTFLGRVIACSLPQEAAERARAKERKRACKQQRVLKEDTLFLCGWLLLLSSVPESQCSDEQLLSLYRARWQIELLIKRFKQLLQLASLRGRTVLSNEATLLALLVAWSLLQEEVLFARAVLTAAVEQWARVQAPAPVQQGDPCLTDAAEQSALAQAPTSPQQGDPCFTAVNVSSWTTTALAVQTLRQVVQSVTTPARVRQCLPWLVRFLCSRHRRRHQESCIRRELLASGILTGASPSLLFSCSSA